MRRPTVLSLFLGPVLVALAVLGMELLEWLVLGVPWFDPSTRMLEGTASLLLTIVVAMLYRYGWAAGFTTLLASLAYRLYYVSLGDAPFRYDVSGTIRATILVVVSLVVFWLVGNLQERARSSALLEARKRLDDEYARQLERQVDARTAELRQANEQLRQLDRIKAELVSNVSHELRTPLTSIKGYAEFLEDELGGPLTPIQSEHVGQIQAGAERLQRLVDDLLDFARLEAGTFRLVIHARDLGATLRQVVDSLRPVASERGLCLELEVPSEPLEASVDGGRVEQVLANLIGNAIKFTPRGGRVVVSARREPEAIAFRVADSGPGIAPEALPHIFDKFYQADGTSTREAGGAGLGLAIAKALVEAHGGTIGVESTPGAGSTFWFRLPIHSASLEPAPA